MTTSDHDPIARLRDADPMRRRLPDDASSPAAARVLERVGAPNPVQAAPQARDRRIRASRALPILAAAAAAVAVVGLSLPKDAPAPVRSVVGTQQAGATSDRAVLLRAAKHQDGLAKRATGAEQAGYEMFMADLSPYPADPTDAQVLSWLDDNCDKMGPASSMEEVPGLDCGLAAVPEMLNEGPPAVAADVLRALASLEVGSPTHADRCANWASADPAWKAKVEQAEADLIWVVRNGTRLSITGTSRLDVRMFSALTTVASPESNVFVQCKPSSELSNDPDLTVSGAGADYAAEHDSACVFGEDEEQGLVPVDLAATCGISGSVGTGSGSEGGDAGAPASQGDPGAVVTGGDGVGVETAPSIDSGVVTTTVGG